MMIPEPHELVRDSVAFAEHMLMIRNDSRQLVPLRYKRAQRHYLKNRTSRDLLLKARQIGFSTLIQAEMFRLYTTAPESMLTMADKQDNTNKLRRIAERFYDNLPPRLPQPVRSEANASVTIYPQVGSEVQIATAGGQTSGRAGTYTLFHGSEVAFWKDAETNIAGALQAIPEHLGNTWVVFETTANGAQGWFFEECMAALQGESEWMLHFYAWWWDDKYRVALESGETLTYSDEEAALVDKHNLTPEQIKWRRKKQRDLKQLFQQEFPESPEQAFLTSGGGVFRLLPENIASGTPTLPYQDGHIYVAGLDWGQDEDYTALSIFRLKTGEPLQEVYMDRWRKQSWYAMRSQVIDALQAYRVEKVVVERNSIGTVNIEDLIHELEAAELDCSVQPFTTTNRSKDSIVKRLQKSMEQEGLLLLDVDYANHELTSYQTKQTATGLWSYSHPDGGHDDTVDARMLANFAATQLWI